ncbi:MAG: M16 family metallopeptidase [Bacteroidales bacterium]
MIKSIKCFSTLLLASLLGFSVMGQGQINWNTPVPVDNSFRYGKLENGLTYYIRKNTEPKECAEFYIAQNVGAILEEDSQNGLAHFLEHMSFNGTKNFPGKGIINYFETVGVKFGYNINAFTSLDETVYNLSDVPTTREGIVDSALLVLHDWSNYLSLDSVEIDSERGVIREEWRTRRSPEFRMSNQVRPIIYKGSKYAIRDVIGDINVINNFKHQVLKDYYKKWYRPDLQSIVIIGDIDVDKVEQKIKSLFADIAKPVNPATREFFELPDNDQPLVGIASDPEARNTMLNVYYKHDATPKDAKNIGYLKDKMVWDLISSMLSSRLSEITQKPNPPYVFAMSAMTDMVRTKSAFMFYAALKNDAMLDGVKGIVREAERVKRFGFTASELDRAKADYLRDLENQLKEKDKQKNEKYVWDAVNNFLDGTPMPGIEFEYSFANGIIPSIKIEDVNAVATKLITDNNMVITVEGPKKDGIELPTEDAVLNALKEVKAENIEAYVDNVSNKPLVESVAKPGKIVKTNAKNIFGTTEFVLSNGAKVIIKQTDFKEDEVIMSAFSQGGLSLADIKSLPSASMATQIVSNSGVGEFSKPDLDKMLAGKLVSVRPTIGGDYEGMSASASPKDFETMLQLVYLYFTSPREDVESYNTYMGRIKAYLANASADPRMAFSDSVSITMANHNPRVMPQNTEFLDKVDFKTTMDFYKSRFADASDFTFIFTGNIKAEDVKGLIEKYIGGLPVVKRKEVAKDNGVRPPKGKVTNIFNKPLQTPKASVYVALTGDAKYNLENMVLANYINSILQNRYLDEIREKEGGSYGVQVGMSISNFPTESFTLRMIFDTDPKMREKLVGIIYSEIEKIKTNGPLEDDLNKAKEYMLKQYDQDQRENKYWSRVIREKYETGIDRNTTYLDVVKAVNGDKIKEFANKMFNQGNIVEVVMQPEEQNN